MNDKDFVGGSVLMLAVATIYLLMAGVIIALARESFVTWQDASAAVRAMSMFGSLAVGALVLGHTTGRRAKAEEE